MRHVRTRAGSTILLVVTVPSIAGARTSAGNKQGIRRAAAVQCTN